MVWSVTYAEDHAFFGIETSQLGPGARGMTHGIEALVGSGLFEARGETAKLRIPLNPGLDKDRPNKPRALRCVEVRAELPELVTVRAIA